MKIEAEVIEIIEQGRIESDKYYLPNIQLNRKLYLKVNKVLECAGGRWNRKSKAHLFTNNIGDLLDTLILSGEICDIKKELQFFETPPKIVELLIKLSGIKSGDRVLEPSAGKGRIAKKLLDIGCKVDTCEIHEPFRQTLISMGCRVFIGDFLGFPNDNNYSHIIANPPFTRQQDIDHVNKMIDICKGRVVSVMSASVLFRENHKTQKFRERINSFNSRFIELPNSSFKESGTMINACIVVINRLVSKNNKDNQ